MQENGILITMSALVAKALDYASKAHATQKRASGELFIEHPKAVADIIQKDIIGDEQTLIATLLHDTIEDTTVTREDIIREFDETVYQLVEGVTKVGQYVAENQLSSQERSQESVRKMLRLMGQDLRVVFIKLADRLHNMRTLGSLKLEKQQRIALETHELYEPLAHLIGISSWYEELADLSAGILQKDEVDTLHYERSQLEQAYLPKLEAWHESLSTLLKTNLPAAKVLTLRRLPISESLANGRKKRQQRTIENFYEVQLVVESTAECYIALGAIHAMYTHVPSKLKDYIGTPRLNGYQAIHTSILTNVQHAMRVRIFSREMFNKQKYGAALPFTEEGKHDWSVLPDRLKRILELEHSQKSSSDFFEALEKEVLGEHIDINVVGSRTATLKLPNPATALDAAFALTTETGMNVEAVTINRLSQTLKTPLENGDIVEFTLANKPKRNPLDRLQLRTHTGREGLNVGLRNLPDNIQVALAQELISVGVDIALDPFFFSSRKKALLHSLWNTATEEDTTLLGIGGLSVFDFLDKMKQPRDFLLLNPHLFAVPTRRGMNKMRYVLQTDIDTLRSGNIIGVQQRPDVISVYAIADQTIEATQKNNELIPLEVVQTDLLEHPFLFGLECHFIAGTSSNFAFSQIQSDVHGMTILNANENRALLQFKALGIENVRYAYRRLASSADISTVHRISI